MPGRLSKCILLTLILIYTTSNFILFASSASAWSLTRRHTTCHSATTCSSTRWSLYSILTPAALIAFVGSATMAANTLVYARAFPIDPLFVFRSVFFSLLLLVPILGLAWSSPYTVDQDVVAPPSYSDPSGRTKTFAGIMGLFVLESLDSSFSASKPAFYMAHVNILFGALIASVSAAMAPPAGMITVLPPQASKPA
ncbi:hypothetical protein CDD81_6777 [Ophiocordyceps australis]|uniref:Uncharacterized protein n=1 Tax=Ophiocordyceps australis TaxID=1399860 RepID=A0A2C5XHE2_9HYPO|nr:hypothetical protein CDD81_6777 [Ophiocordyceps australis]